MLSEVTFDLIHRENKQAPVRIALSHPTEDMHHVGQSLRETLNALALEAPVLEIVTRVEHVHPSLRRRATSSINALPARHLPKNGAAA